jgi:hypothetical protein
MNAWRDKIIGLCQMLSVQSHSSPHGLRRFQFAFRHIDFLRTKKFIRTEKSQRIFFVGRDVGRDRFVLAKAPQNQSPKAKDWRRECYCKQNSLLVVQGDPA